MPEWVWLLIIGLFLMLAAVALLYRLKPRISICPPKIEFEEFKAKGGRLATSLVGVLFLAGLACIVSGIFLAIIPGVSQLREALGDTRAAIEKVAPPVPTPTPVEPSAEELFSLAFSADEASNNDVAIRLYRSAIDAGLDPARAELAHIEIGLLELLEIEEDPDDPTDVARCNSARSSIEAADAIGLPEHEALADQLRQLFSSSTCATGPP